MEGFILPLLLFVILYFALIRPQQRKMKEQQALVNRASAGDNIMLSSGIFGTITEVVDTACYVELADGIEILVSRAFIQEIVDEFPTGAGEGTLEPYLDDDAIDEIEGDDLDLEEDDSEVDA